MEAYPTRCDESKNPVAVHVPSSRWSLAARLAQTWCYNANARGIAEPDPRTVPPGRRARRALASPCPWSRRRVRRERRIQAALAQVGPTLTRLTALANVWPDPARPHELARRLTQSEAHRAWLVDDPAWTRRSYERATPLYLPRLSDRDATRFLRAHRDALRFIRFAEAQLTRERDDRLRSLLASLHPSRPPGDLPITRRPDERRDISTHSQPPVGTGDWREVADRIAERIRALPPDDAM